MAVTWEPLYGEPCASGSRKGGSRYMGAIGEFSGLDVE